MNYQLNTPLADANNFIFGLELRQIIFWLIIIAILIIIIVVIRSILFIIFRRFKGFSRKIFLVMMPKEAEEEEKKHEAIDQKKNIDEMIAIAETLYSNLAGIVRPKTRGYLLHRLKKFWIGSDHHLSLEIVVVEGKIRFYYTVPEHLAPYVEQQIHAEYPNAQIEETDDYNIFSPHGFIFGSYLKLTKNPILPIKTYKKIDADPLDGIFNNLSKIKRDEGAVIQILLKPASKKWNRRALSFSRALSRGKKVEEVLSTHNLFKDILLAPFKLIKFFWEALKVNAKNKESQPPLGEEKPLPAKIYQREEELIKVIDEQVAKANFVTNIRLISSAQSLERTKQLLYDIISSFSQYASHEISNSFTAKPLWLRHRFIHDFIYRNFRSRKQTILSTEELASIYHFPLPSSETPNIQWLLARRAPAPQNIPSEGLILGKNIYRGIETEIKIKRDDRRRHVYIIGKSGVGKSVFLANLAIQDIKNGEGVAVIDPHGDLIADILPQIPRERADDVIIFNPSDVERPIGLNMLEYKTEEQKDFAVQEMVAIFYKLFSAEIIGPMFEHYMRNAMLALMEDREDPGTIVEIPRLFTDREFRKAKLQKVRNLVVKNFWEQEYEQSQRGQQVADMLSYVISKIGRFITNDMMRNIIGQPTSGFNFREVMDKQKVLLVNLSKGTTGEVNSSLLGLIIVSKLQMAALSRAELPQEQRKDFYLYIDEFQNFITDSIATILSEARKYRLNLIIAHQYINQLVINNDTKIRDAVLGNAGTIVSFRIGVEDAELIAKEMTPVFNEYDVINIEKYTAYIRLLIDNTVSKAFNLMTYPPLPVADQKISQMLQELSRLKYGRDRRIVESEIKTRSQLGELGKRPVGVPEISL